jgi:phosphoribosylformylglycinamidine cyclo-ligase
LAANLARVLPNDVHVTIDRATWELPAIFGLVQQVGGLAQSDLEEALNIGVGMVALVPGDAAEAALAVLAERQIDAWVAGEVAPAESDSGPGTVELVGSHA